MGTPICCGSGSTAGSASSPAGLLPDRLAFITRHRVPALRRPWRVVSSLDEMLPRPPAVPDPDDDPFAAPVDVGEFRRGTALSQWALARYLVGRALVESVGWSLLVVAVVALALSALLWWGADAKFFAVLLLVVAIGVLLMRWVLLGVVRRLTGFARYGPLEVRIKALVDDTRPDVLRELRRVQLPGRLWTVWLLAVRFLGRERRRDTLTRLRRFEVERAVPKARLDELHVVLQTALGGGVTPPG